MENQIGVLGLLTKEDVEKMTRPALIDMVLRFNEKYQQNAILAMPVRNVLQKLASYFLSKMKRPNLPKKSKSGRRPAKNLKWFNTTER